MDNVYRSKTHLSKQAACHAYREIVVDLGFRDGSLYDIVRYVLDGSLAALESTRSPATSVVTVQAL